MSCDGPDCEDALAKLYEFIDHEIDTASCDQIESHLESCADCLTEFQMEQVVKMIVSRSCTETAPAPLRERVLMQIRAVQIEIRTENY
mgnify:CR=1 FL=1